MGKKKDVRIGYGFDLSGLLKEVQSIDRKQGSKLKSLKKTKEFDKKTEIIKTFLKSGIYCNNHHYLWFRNKLRTLAEKDYISHEEIDSLTDYFKIHSLNNKQKANTPFPIADRIRKRKGEIIVVSEEEYDNKQMQYEYEVRCTELNRQKRYDEYIELLNHMIGDMDISRSYVWLTED